MRTRLDEITEALERAHKAINTGQPMKENPSAYKVWSALYELIEIVEDDVRAMGGKIPGSEDYDDEDDDE